MENAIDTDRFSKSLRARSIDVAAETILVTNLRGTEQERDLTEAPNCRGFGRIRHFNRYSSAGWPCNPLPIDPACKALKLHPEQTMLAQVFQNASCNWRCWYCYVPFSLLSADPKSSGWLSAAQLVDLYLEADPRPKIIDLTGGQPDLVPEWVPWMMKELRARGLEREVYLWSDDNLSNDYWWQYLSKEDQTLVATYPNYGKVCCLKGFNEESFVFNTGASADHLPMQLDLLHRYVDTTIDLYGYITLTTPNHQRIASDMHNFMNQLQGVHPNLPLRIVPLRISEFHPVAKRMNESHQQAMRNQEVAIEAWQGEIASRFTESERNRSITDVPIGPWRQTLR